MPWDCKVTPVDCTCQEGNTICCISSNDGLDADLRTCFPHGGRKSESEYEFEFEFETAQFHEKKTLGV